MSVWEHYGVTCNKYVTGTTTFVAITTTSATITTTVPLLLLKYLMLLLCDQSGELGGAGTPRESYPVLADVSWIFNTSSVLGPRQ